MLGSIRLLLGVTLLFLGIVAKGTEIEVARVAFNLVDEAGSRDPWYEVTLALSVEKGEAGDDANPRFADNIVVSLALATEVDRKAGKGYQFYVSRVEYPTLEVGQHAVRFYLPPELVKRDRVKGEPYAYEIEVISQEEHEFSMVSKNLERPGALAAFHERVQSRSSAASDLRPQYKTPFAWTYPRDTPNPRF